MGNISYTEKDIQGIREEIFNFIKETNSDFNDFNVSSIQQQYTELLAGVADMLCYYLDQQALETFLTTARQARNIRAQMATLNYEFDGMGTAKGEIKVTRGFHYDNSNYYRTNTAEGDETQPIYDLGTGEVIRNKIYYPGRFCIPKWSTVYSLQDKKGPHFVTVEEAYMGTNVDEITIPVAQGVVQRTKIPVDLVRENYKMYISDTPIPTDYVEILDEGWVRVEDAFCEITGGKKYSVHTDSKNRVYILFTYNWTKFLSTAEDDYLTVLMLISEGESGMCEAGYLNTFGFEPYDVDNPDELAYGYLNVTNEDSTYGAFDRVNLNVQKANAKNFIKVYNRIVLREDFETMLMKEPWIRHCVVYDWRKNDHVVRYPHQMKAWVITNEGADLKNSQLLELTKKLQDITVSMTQLEIRTANYVDLTFKVGINLTGTNTATKEPIRQLVEQTLNSRYTLSAFLDYNNKESKLKFAMELDPEHLEVEVAQIHNAIVDVEIIGIEEPIKLLETEFFNIENIEVYLMEDTLNTMQNRLNQIEESKKATEKIEYLDLDALRTR